MSDKHTPLPWTEDQDGHYIWAESIGSCNLEMTKHMVAEIRGWGHLRYLGEDIAVDIQKANQELIVRAVNNHRKLVERLSEMTEAMAALMRALVEEKGFSAEAGLRVFNSLEEYDGCGVRAQQALSAAKGES